MRAHVEFISHRDRKALLLLTHRHPAASFASSSAKLSSHVHVFIVSSVCWWKVSIFPATRRARISNPHPLFTLWLNSVDIYNTIYPRVCVCVCASYSCILGKQMLYSLMPCHYRALHITLARISGYRDTGIPKYQEIGMCLKLKFNVLNILSSLKVSMLCTYGL